MFVKPPAEGYREVLLTVFKFFIEASIYAIALNFAISLFGVNTPGFLPSLLLVSFFHLLP
jgi:hypothetical protein